MGSPRSLMILLCLISLAAAETCSGGLALLASRRLLQKGHAQVLEVQTPCAGPSNGWRIRATTSSCGWCWDVNELELLTESGRLGLVDYDWGDWIRDCQPESSGNPDNGRYVPGRAFDGDEGSNWGGRKQTEDYFHLGLRCNNSYVVNKVRILSERATAEEIRIERLEGGIWKHVHLTGQKSNSWETIYECVITSTTSTTTLAIQSSPFAAADGGLNRACRGRNVSDNLPQNYKVTQASTLAQCQMQCLQEPKCQGVEFSSGRCELWIQAVGATAAVPGFECWRYVEPQTRGFFPVDGGFGRACRGASRGDNSPSHYQVVSASSLKICQDRCLGTSGCGGIEYSMGRCELWTRAGGIGASAPVQGFMCLHLLPDFVGVDGGESRVCRGASATDNSMAYYEVVSTRSVQNCTSECRAKTNCQGFEFSLGRCELWIRPEGVGATAEAAGYICMKRLPSTTVTTTGSGAFQFFKFVPIQLRHNGIADAVALSELQLYEGGKAISLAGATATAAGGESVPEEEPGMVLDEDVSTKWLDKNISDLVVQLPQPMKVDAFSFITGNDHSQRDPMQWAILASTDGSSWTNAQLQLSDYETPTMRQAPSHRFAIQAGQWAMRIRAVNTNTGWMWVLHGLQMTTGTGALIEPNAICTPFDSGSAFDGDPYQPWYRDKSGTWKSGELRTEPGFWFGLQCSCPQDVRNVRFLQMCSGHFADEVILEQFQNGAWEPLTVTKAECDDWTVVYNSTAAMPEEKPCPFPVPAVPPVSAPSPEAIPLCQESSTPSEGCMGVTVSEHLMGRFFAQTPGFTVRSSNFCNNRFCLTPMRMSMESCSDRLLLAWTAHLSWEGSTQITVGHVSEFRYHQSHIELISDKELDDCAEMGRLSVSPDCTCTSLSGKAQRAKSLRPRSM
ncbi:unnamed protein product [Effrenium voratum]|uniref:Apple domain-containing protein n=1 Tax=Effrenium voratum TaxID=2562239 RepID=A0AA36IIV9_9DINO|nr:unnamed protein product [Effrenium voratum]